MKRIIQGTDRSRNIREDCGSVFQVISLTADKNQELCKSDTVEERVENSR